MLLALALVAAAPTAAPAPPVEAVAPAAPAILAVAGEVRASQIARVPATADRVVARLPEGTAAAQWSEAERLALVRNRYPGRPYPLLQTGTVRLVRAPGPAPAATPASGDALPCFASTTPIAAGTYLAPDMLTPAACDGAAQGGWLAYDAAAGAFRARRAIPAGTCLGRFAEPTVPGATEGARLVYRTGEGPVTVEREVVALQSARVGRAVFVRAEDGTVLAAPLAVEARP